MEICFSRQFECSRLKEMLRVFINFHGKIHKRLAQKEQKQTKIPNVEYNVCMYVMYINIYIYVYDGKYVRRYMRLQWHPAPPFRMQRTQIFFSSINMYGFSVARKISISNQWEKILRFFPNHRLTLFRRCWKSELF